MTHARKGLAKSRQFIHYGGSVENERAIEVAMIEVRSFLGLQLEPRVTRVKEALITCTTFDKTSNTYSGAVYDQFGSLVLDGLRPSPPLGTYRPAIPVCVNRNDHLDAADTRVSAIYGGHFFYAWGHFLLETLGTAYAAESLPNVPVVFSPWPFTFSNEWTEKFIAHAIPLLFAAGWDDREIIISHQAQRVRELFVPARLTAIGNWDRAAIHPRMADVFASIRSRLGRKRIPGRKLVAMRPSGHRRMHNSETALYNLLRAMEYEAYELHELSSSEQVELVSSADVMVAFSGSTLHNSIFLHPRGLVIEIGDDVHRPYPLQTQVDLCRVCQHEHYFISGYNPEPVSPSVIAEKIERSWLMYQSSGAVTGLKND